MWELIQTNQKALGAAVGIHLMLLLVMFFGVNWTDDAKPLPVTPVVQATVVDQAALDKEIKKLKAAEDKKRKQKEAAEKKKKAEAKRKAAEKKRKAEAKRKAAEKKKFKGIHSYLHQSEMKM